MHYEKICREFIYLTVLCDHPYLVSLLHAALLSLHLDAFSIFIITCLHHGLAAGTCLSWSFPSQSSKTLSSQVADFFHWQYWLKNHWPIVWVNPFLDRQQSQLSLSEDQVYPQIHAVTGIQIVWIILPSFIYSFIHIIIFTCMTGIYLSLFKFDWQHNAYPEKDWLRQWVILQPILPVLQSHAQAYQLLFNSVILSNNFVLPLSDL